VVTGDDVLQQVIAFISPTIILNFIAKGKELSCKVLSESAGKLPYLIDLGVVLSANDLLAKPFHNDAFTSTLCFRMQDHCYANLLLRTLDNIGQPGEQPIVVVNVSTTPHLK